jgi:AcrR family transcriptional regulator
MPRPQRYDTDALLDAAAAILAADGPAAVTMSAVARVTGAPSGSMYHRFPTRAALCGRLWVRTQERFHVGLLAALAEAKATDPQEQCVAGARYTVRWCRDTPVQARVLLAGADALDRGGWPDDLVSRCDVMRRELERALRTPRRRDGDRVAAALIDIPNAVVGRHLRAGKAVPASAEEIVEDCARALVR